jgi:hypothetical protein
MNDEIAWYNTATEEELESATSRFIMQRNMRLLSSRAAQEYGDLLNVTFVPAYASFEELASEFGAASPAPKDDSLLHAFEWQFFVPSDEDSSGKRRSDEEVLRDAVELASLPEAASYRRAFRAWCAMEHLKGTSPTEAKDKMEHLLQRYGSEIRRSKIPVKVRWGSAIIGCGASLASIFMPIFGVVGAITGLTQFMGGEFKNDAPKELLPAAMIHTARQHFGSASPRLLTEFV